MTLPLFLLVGNARSGKDTVAKIIKRELNGAIISQADPIKRMARYLFNFSPDQLWGPSEFRDQIDPHFKFEEYVAPPYTLKEIAVYRRTQRVLYGKYQPVFKRSKHWDDVFIRIVDNFTKDWVKEVLGHVPDPIYNAAINRIQEWLSTVFETNKETGISPRIILQTLATEWGRKIKRDIWVDYTRDIAINLLGGGCKYDKSVGLTTSPLAHPAKAVIISDGRFANEVVSIAKMNGIVWRIINPDLEDKTPYGKHVSEQEQALISDIYFDKVIVNDKKQGLSALTAKVKEALYEHC